MSRRSASSCCRASRPLCWAFLRGSGFGTTFAGEGVTVGSGFGTSIGFSSGGGGGGFFCSRMNSTMRSGTACSTAGFGGFGSSGMTMPKAMKSPMTAAVMRRNRRSSSSDGVQGRMKLR